MANWTPLGKAASHGNIDVIKNLICEGAKVNNDNNEGQTALQIAANKGLTDVIEYLIREGADINKEDNNGWTALHRAAFHSQIDVIETLISKGAEVNKEDKVGRAALEIAAQNGHIDVIKYLISKGAEVIKEDRSGWTALHSAASSGHTDVITYLISEGAKVNKEDKDDQTALHIAASNGHLDVIKYLISKGAEVNKGNNDGQTELHIAARLGHIEAIKYLISKGGDVNEGDKEGTTALHFAVQNGYIDVVKVLLAGGARCDTEDIHGQTPLHQSITIGDRDIADLLVDSTDAKSSTVFHLVLKHGYTSIIEKLIARGFDLNVQSSDGQTCLHKAIRSCYHKKQNVEYTETLRKVSEEYYSGRLSPEKALVFYLLEHGAMIDIKDEADCLPIHYAKDEVIRQMILARLPSFDDVQSTRDPDMSSQMIHPSRGGTIELPAHGISLFIPVLALRKECRITMKVLPQPSSPLITEDEALVSPGVIFEPSGTIFDTPLRLVVPHCAILTDPSMVMVNMHVTQGDKVTKEELSPTGMPRCVVRQDKIEVYINHFSIYELFMVISDYFLGKHVASTPYLPKSLSRLQPQCCHLRLYNDIPGLEDIIGTEEEKLGYVKMAPTKKIFVLWEKGELKIKCDVNSGHVTESEKAVSLDEIYRLDRNVVNFLVKATGNSDVYFSFHFRPHCDDGHVFNAKFGDITDASSSTCSKRLDDKVLYDLANEIENDDHLDRLMQALKVASGAQQRCHDLNRLEGQVTARGTHRMLMDWRAETAVVEQHDRLKGALTDAKLLDLRDRFFSLEIT